MQQSNREVPEAVFSGVAAHRIAMSCRTSFKRARAYPIIRLGLVSAVLFGSVLVSVAVRGYNRSTPIGVGMTKPSVQVALPIGKATKGVHQRLSFQPEADRLRRSLGLRFLTPGLEKAVLIGTLTIGADRSLLRMVRTQSDDGEQVEIAVGAVASSLIWTPAGGAKVDGGRALGNSRAIIERLVLDSPDEFVLAQLRGASYYTVARNVMPKNAAGSEDYNGPVWDVVRVGEPDALGTDAALSKSRIFHINTQTGLIDRCFSREEGETVVAEISGWADQFGEKVPTHITWNKNGKVVMELSLSNIAHGPRQ